MREGMCVATPPVVTPVLVRHIMSSPVVTFFAEQTLPLAEDVMRFKHLRHLPVVDDKGYLVGIVTHRDLLRAKLGTSRSRSNIRVDQVMTRDVWTVTSDTLASTAGSMLLDHGFGCLPIVDGTHRLVGIITEADYLRFAIHTLRMNDPESHIRAITHTVRLAS
jgi:CBS domain-containing membrane protein